MSLFGVSESYAVGESTAIEAEIARLRYRQAALLGELYLAEIARTNGTRSGNEYVASRFDGFRSGPRGPHHEPQPQSP